MRRRTFRCREEKYLYFVTFLLWYCRSTASFLNSQNGEINISGYNLTLTDNVLRYVRFLNAAFFLSGETGLSQDILMGGAWDEQHHCSRLEMAADRRSSPSSPGEHALCGSHFPFSTVFKRNGRLAGIKPDPPSALSLSLFRFMAAVTAPFCSSLRPWASWITNKKPIAPEEKLPGETVPASIQLSPWKPSVGSAPCSPGERDNWVL